MAKKSIVKQKWFEKFLSPHVRWIKDVYSYSIQVSHLAIGLMGCFEVFTSGFAWAVLRTLGFYINFRQLAINGHQCCVLAHASPLSVLKHALRRKCSLMATPSKQDSSLLYNMYHPCVTESLRLSLSSVFCAKIIFLSRSCFSSSPTLLSS